MASLKFLIHCVSHHRIASLERERKMAEVMTKYMSEDIRTLKVKEKWCLETGGECYSHLVTQLQTINTVSSPLQKMSCAGRYYQLYYCTKSLPSLSLSLLLSN